MTIQDLDIVTPQSLINTRPVMAVIEFFGSSPLSQFMDQTILAEPHKRRMSALSWGFEERELRSARRSRQPHGRMCPIETPEARFGLIHLATYARINEYGFIEAPHAGR